jgi:3alpha(or 20beta)-hydroxysteroid dehydrogenase
VRGQTKAAALELARDRIRVNSVHPGFILTPLADAGPAPSTSLVPLGRIGEAAEVGQLVVYLASDESSFATGAEFVLDGGQGAGRIVWGVDEDAA